MNALYDKGREGFLDGDISWSRDRIRTALINTDEYDCNLAADKFLSEVPALARVQVSAPLMNKTTYAGSADADDIAFLIVPSIAVRALLIYQDTGDENTSRLIAYLDSVAGLPIQTAGGDITIIWDNGPSKIFKL